MICTPSSLARSISSREAVSSFSGLRKMSVTLFAPRRFAVTATSIATLPPPMTMTFSRFFLFIHLLTSTRNSRPNSVNSSPSKPSTGRFHAPVA